MKKSYIFFLYILFLSTTNSIDAQQNVSISDANVTPDASSVLDISSTTKGLLIPRLALSATNAAAPITLPATSMLVYNTAISGTAPNNVTPGYYYNAGTPTVPNWLRIYAGSTAGAEWKLLGNAGTDANTNFLGTTDLVDLVFRTNNIQRARINSIGNMGVGVAPMTALGQAILSVSRDGVNACCGGENSTLALGEATTSTGRRPSISFHASGESEGVIHITQASTGIGVIGIDRRIKFFDNQSQGLGIELTGNLWYGTNNSRTQWRDNAGLRGDAGAQSGFFETYNPVNYPTGATSWWHLLDVRHNNPTNNYAMQFAGSFFDQNLYFRKTSDNASQAWSQVVTSTSNLAWMTTGNSGTVANTNFIGTTDAIDFVIRTSNTEKVRVLSGGNVGIGTSVPAKPLDVAGIGGIRISQTANASTDNEIFFQDNGQIRSLDNNHRLIFDRSSDIMEMREYGDLIFSPGATASARTQKVTMKASGNVGIGINAPVATFHVYGINAPTCAIISSNTSYYTDWPGGWGGGLASWDLCVASIRLSGTSTRSDVRLKKNIQDLQNMNALSLIDKLRPVSFGYIDPRMKREKVYGFIAQEIQKILPEIVEEGTDSMKTLGMSYTDLIPILTQGIKEQQIQILDLKEKNLEYEKRIAILEEKLNQLLNGQK
ncbi:MAG: tail fiber domain-containing protein [Flavobacteriales bacterium]|nr:tail fiber domain-containing protein [Flavobacteriales bacterium]